MFATRRMQGWLYHGTLIVIWAQDVAGYDDRFGPRLLLFTAVKIVLGDGNPSLRGQTTGQSPRLNYAGMPRYCSDSLGHNQATPCHFVSRQSPLFSRTA